MTVLDFHRTVLVESALFKLTMFALAVSISHSQLQSESTQGNNLTPIFVCLGGDLSLTCNARRMNNTYLRIEISIPQSGSQTLTITNTSNDSITLPDVAEFRFFKTTFCPLTGTLMITNTSAGLNATTVNCSGIIERNIIYIIAADTFSVTSLRIHNTTKEENVTVSLEWNETEYNNVYYNVLTVPPLDVEKHTRTRYELEAAYNVMYTVFVNSTLCNESTFQNITTFQFVRCNDPQTNDDGSIIVSKYSHPGRVEGSTVTFSCNNLSSSVITGPWPCTAMCMSNGEWEPDPSQINCEACSPNESWVSNSEDHNHTESSSIINSETQDVVIIIGSTTGASILLIACVLFIVIFSVVKSKRGSLFAQRSNQVLVDNNYVDTQPAALVEISSYEDVLVLPQQSRAETITYADLGPFSLGRPSTLSTTLIDDGHIEYAQIVTGAQAAAYRRNEEPTLQAVDTLHTADKRLNLNSLLMQIKSDVSSKWYEFGKAIGVPNELLDDMTDYPPEQNIIEVCDYWLKNHTGKPLWKEATAALKNIDFQHLANDIEKVYETGKLPIEDDPRVPEGILEIETPPPIPPRLSDISL